MPLPLILVGAAIVAGGYGAKKGLDAMSDFDKAKRINKKAQQIHGDAKESLEVQHGRTQKHLDDLVRQKTRLHQYGLKPFVTAFKKIKNINYAELSDNDFALDIKEGEILRMEETVAKMEEVLTGTLAAATTGALVGWAVYGGVGLLGTASTGTAIATLSGAAAKSATLAWLGGGSLAAGGSGIIGGTVALGGVIAAPALLVIGSIMASKGEEAVAEARSNLRKAETAAEAIKTAVVKAKTFSSKANEVRKVLHRLQTEYLDADLAKLKRLVSANDDFRTYNKKQKHLVTRTVAVAKLVYSVAEAPLLGKNDAVTTEIETALQKANEFLEAINAI